MPSAKSRSQEPDSVPASKAARSQQVEAALDVCLARLAEVPDDPALNERAGLVALRAGRFAEARTMAQRSLALRPDHAPTLVLLGRAARASGYDLEAIEAFRRAIRVAPERAEAAFLLCAALLATGNAQAREMLTHLLARFPGEASGWDEIGQVLLAAGKPEAALVCVARAAQAEPSFARLMQLGLIQRDLGHPGEACSAFARATTLDRGSARAWFLLGTCHQDAREFAAASAAYRTALAVDPALAEAAVNLGTTLQEAGDLEGAKRAYGRALALRPDTFGRVAQAITASPKGELWFDLGQLRHNLAGQA